MHTRRFGTGWWQPIAMIALGLLCGVAAADDDPGAPPTGTPPAGTAPADAASDAMPADDPQGDAKGPLPTSETTQRVPSERERASIQKAVEDGQRLMNLSLADAIRMGAEANLGLLSASYESPIARQGAIAADANFDTLLTASFDVARNETPVTNIFQGDGELLEKTVAMRGGLSKNLRNGGSVSLLYRADRLNTNNPFAVINPSWIQGTVLEARQPLLRGAGDVALSDIRRAQNSVVAARAGYDAQAQDTVLQVIATYWELVFAESNLDARVQAEKVARELLTDATARLDAEVGTPLDVAEARAGVERRVSEVLQSENLRASVQDDLLALIMPFGQNTARNIRVIPTDASLFDYRTLPTPGQEDRYVRLALAGRPELLAQRAEIASRGVDVYEAHNAIRPQLDVRGSIGPSGLGLGYGTSFRDMADARAVSGSIGLEFSMFIGQRAAKATWMAANWRRRQAQLTYKELENQIIVQVRSALRDIETARGQVRAGREEVKAANEEVDGERLRLEQGKSTPFNVLLKVNNLTDAQTRLARAAADVRLAESRLWYSVGTLISRMQVDVERWRPCPECR